MKPTVQQSRKATTAAPTGTRRRAALGDVSNVGKTDMADGKSKPSVMPNQTRIGPGLVSKAAQPTGIQKNSSARASTAATRTALAKKEAKNAEIKRGGSGSGALGAATTTTTTTTASTAASTATGAKSSTAVSASNATTHTKRKAITSAPTATTHAVSTVDGPVRKKVYTVRETRKPSTTTSAAVAATVKTTSTTSTSMTVKASSLVQPKAAATSTTSKSTATNGKPVSSLPKPASVKAEAAAVAHAKNETVTAKSAESKQIVKAVPKSPVRVIPRAVQVLDYED